MGENETSLPNTSLQGKCQQSLEQSEISTVLITVCVFVCVHVCAHTCVCCCPPPACSLGVAKRNKDCCFQSSMLSVFYQHSDQWEITNLVSTEKTWSLISNVMLENWCNQLPVHFHVEPFQNWQNIDFYGIRICNSVFPSLGVTSKVVW